MMGESFLIWLQQYSNGVLDTFFGTITYLGSESFYLIWIPIIYWCIDKAVGVRLALIASTSAFTNVALKDGFATSRPDPLRVRVLLPETGGGYSFPSGHSQGTTTFWFTLVREYSHRWLLVAGSLIVFFVIVSRMYLGLHYPVDVVGGFILGLIFAMGGVVLLKRLTEPFLRLPLVIQFAAAAILPLVLLILNQSESALHLVGNICGFSVGALMERQWIRFEVREGLMKQLVKVVLGIAVLFGVRMGLKALFPEGDLFEFLRYAFIGLSGAVVVPFIFTRIKLSADHDRSLRL